MFKEGMIFKNYKELCEYMCWETTRGNYMKARLKELDSLCKWHRQGNKIVIEMVYEVRLPKDDGRYKSSTYINPVEEVLLFILKNSDNSQVYLSNAKMYKMLGLFNEKFEKLNYGDTNAIVEEIVVDYLTAKSFKINSKAEANKIIKRALNSMRDRRVVDYIEGRIIVDLKGDHRMATPEEVKLFTSIEKEALNEVGCLNFSQLEYRNLTYKYHSLIKEKISKHNIEGVDYSYHGYCVISHNKILAEEIDRQRKEKSFYLLNELFVEKMKAIALTRHTSAVKKLSEDTGFGENMALGEASPSFLSDYDKMISNYIAI